MSTYHKLSWDEKSKQKARENINNHKPWLKSTGPKTKEGKEISKMNALKNNYEIHSLVKELNMLIKEQKKAISLINTSLQK